MSESESRIFSGGWSPDPEAKPDRKTEKRWHELYQDLHLPVTGSTEPTPKRTRPRWEPTARERAILRLPAPGTKDHPGAMKMDAYCQALDDAGILFPEKWQKRGKPKTHREAWESKDERLQHSLMSERHNAWKRLRKGF